MVILMIRYYPGGIDASAATFDVHLVVGRKGQEGRFEQTPGGFQDLEDWLVALDVKRGWFGIEHTGGYEASLARHLVERGHRVSLLDGKSVLKFKESEGKKSKTDRGDARMIAKYVSDKRPALWTPRSDAFVDLLELKKHRDDLVGSITAWQNRRNAPKTNQFVHIQQETQIQVLKVQLEEVEKEIKRLARTDPEISRSVDRMDSVTGIGFTTAVAFLAEAGPINRKTYPSPESLALAAGLAPLPWMSGTTVNRTYSKPYGNQNLRNCLNLCACTAKKHDPALGLFAKRMEQRGKCPAVQNRAIKRKLVHILWAVVVNDEDYIPEKAVWRLNPKKT